MAMTTGLYHIVILLTTFFVTLCNQLSRHDLFFLSMIARTNPSVYVFGLSNSILSLTHKNTVAVCL